MKKVKIEDAIGMTLCHDITAMYEGFKGAAFKRGHVIKEEDVKKLLDYGKKYIYIWEEEPSLIHEEDASKRIANMNILDNAHYSEISEGKTQLIADERGLFIVDLDLLAKINKIQDVTISTLPNHYRVEKGMRLASMRIIPLFTKEENIIKAEELNKNKKLYEILPYREKKVGIIITGSEIYNHRIEDKFEKVCREKLNHFPSNIFEVFICDDDIEMIKNKTKILLDNKCDIIIYSGGMSVDPDDLTPTVIRELGCDIISHGVPSQPGNMTLVAYKDNVTFLGIPGAAVSLKTTVFDVLLPQVFTDLKFTKEDLINIANGGLCQLCANCHFPNCTFGRY